jgi:hypothetical protein
MDSNRQISLVSSAAPASAILRRIAVGMDGGVLDATASRRPPTQARLT